MSLEISVGSQAGIFESHVIASYIIELLKKCHEIRDLYGALAEELKQGRESLNEHEQTIDNMQITVQAFSETMDKIGVRMLQENIAVSQRHTQIDALKRDIAVLSEYIETGSQHQQATTNRKEEHLNDVKTRRGKMGMQLAKMKTNIDNTYEDLFETQEKLISLKDLREMRREAETVEIAALKDKSASATDRKRSIFMITDKDSFNLSEMYVNPTAFAKLEEDIEILKRQQVQMDKHIQMQLYERAFLRDTANSIIQRVFELEKKVRKETGDHGWESALSVEPKWYQEYSTPSVWHSSLPITTDQLKRMQELYTRKVSPARAICDENESEATSGETSDGIVVINMQESSIS